MAFRAEYDGLSSEMIGTTFTNIQDGRGYVYFAELELVLPVTVDSLDFIVKGTELSVNFLSINKDKLNDDQISETNNDKSEKIEKKLSFKSLPSFINILKKIYQLEKGLDKLTERVKKLEQVNEEK